MRVRAFNGDARYPCHQQAVMQLKSNIWCRDDCEGAVASNMDWCDAKLSMLFLADTKCRQLSIPDSTCPD